MEFLTVGPFLSYLLRAPLTYNCYSNTASSIFLSSLVVAKHVALNRSFSPSDSSIIHIKKCFKKRPIPFANLSQMFLIHRKMRNSWLGRADLVCARGYKERGPSTWAAAQFRVKLSSFRGLEGDLHFWPSGRSEVLNFHWSLSKAYHICTNCIWILGKRNIFIPALSLDLGFKRLQQHKKGKVHSWRKRTIK